MLPARWPAAEEWIDEMIAFPNGGSRVHDDQVDAAVYALRELQVGSRFWDAW